MRHHQPTRDYVERRTAEGLTKTRDHPLPQALHRPRDLQQPPTLQPSTPASRSRSHRPLDEHRSIERFQQTLKRHLATLEPADTIDTLQHQLDTFIDLYNTTRPHRSLDRVTPAVAYQRLAKANPTPPPQTPANASDATVVDTSGVVTLRYNGRLHHIGIGRTHARTPVLLLVDDRDIRVINATTGEVLREHSPSTPPATTNPMGRPPGPPRKAAPTPRRNAQGLQVPDRHKRSREQPITMSRDFTLCARRDSNPQPAG